MGQKIAFIGLGIMGKPMAKNLISGGYELYVYDLFPDPVAELEKEGATGCKSAAEASSNTSEGKIDGPAQKLCIFMYILKMQISIFQ